VPPDVREDGDMNLRRQESEMRASAVLLTLAVAIGGAAVGCAPTGQGDPCTPEAIPTGGFSNMEVYVETSSVQCRTRVCMVYRLTGSPQCTATSDLCLPSPRGACLSGMTSLCLAPEVDGMISTQPNSPDRVFCTCRCSAGGNSSLPLCHCTDGFVCIPDADPGGGYCVPHDLATAEHVLCFGAADCTSPQVCDPSTHHCQ
jgi:hypothetical protein